jgi:selenocysteine lyase/cysteine desulfurase
MRPELTRRDWVRLLGGSAAALWLPRDYAWAKSGSLQPAPAAPDESYWSTVREQFVMPNDLAVLNAANLCPSSAAALDSLYQATREMDREPSPAYREQMHEAKEVTRRLLAAFLRVTPEEIVVTRNTSESNNLVSNGLDLKPGDEVLLYYVEAFTNAITTRTRVMAFTHLTSTVGDVLPARELCRIARERGILTLVDGAQSFGLLDVDLRDMDPDFYSGSGHKWPCGPKEAGVLFVNRRSAEKLWPSIYSAYPGAIGISKTFESFGQRDEPAIRAFGEALQLQSRVGRSAIERRAQELAQALVAGLRALDGVSVWTHPDPARSSAIVSFRPGSLDPDRLTLALYAKDRIVCAKRTGADRGGIRLSPHFYNSHAEVERAVGAVARYLATGV